MILHIIFLQQVISIAAQLPHCHVIIFIVTVVMYCYFLVFTWCIVVSSCVCAAAKKTVLPWQCVGVLVGAAVSLLLLTQLLPQATVKGVPLPRTLMT